MLLEHSSLKAEVHAFRRILKDLRESTSDCLKEHKSEYANSF